MNILNTEMDSRPYTGMHEKDGALEDWQQNAVDTLARSLDRTNDPAYAMQRAWPSMHKSIRAITPEPKYDEEDPQGAASPGEAPSPRSIPGGEKPRERRAGLVFEDSYSAESTEGNRPGQNHPPLSYQQRPRTRTLEEPKRHRHGSNSVSKSRHRIGSVHSTNASSFHDVAPRIAPDTSNSSAIPSASTRPPPPSLQKSNSVKGGRRLVKRSSRPTSPLQIMPDIPSVDSLPMPVATGDANKLSRLMNTLCGRMKGEVEYQMGATEDWYIGTCYIDEPKASLMFEGKEKGSFHLTIISDLRGCRVRPVIPAERQVKCLEVIDRDSVVDVKILPVVRAEYDLWLAAFLGWQQIRSVPFPPSPPRTTATQSDERRPDIQRSGSDTNQPGSSDSPKPANIIKVAKLQLWDKGAPTSPMSIVRQPSTKNFRSTSRSCWRKVSCILQDNGELRILTENDITHLSIIQLSQLSRSAIQRLDRSVLHEEYCIAIFPQYTSTSTQLSIFRPVCISLECRLTFEVWFCLLRAFTIPEIYGPPISDAEDEYDVPEYSTSHTPANDMFRIEKSLSLRIIEAKLPKSNPRPEIGHGRQSVKPELDPSVGDYFVEVMLDGEIRARTNTKCDTRNPFWREECEFPDLPSHVPKLSLVLKRLKHPEPASHGFLSSSSIHIPDLPSESLFGTVEVSVEKLDRGKDSETWWPIMNDLQEPAGEILLRVRHDEIVVLLAKEYQEVSELLHRFSSGLTIQISQAIPSHLRQLSEILMNVFQVSGSTAEWLMTLVEDEIDGIGKEAPIKRLRWSRRLGSNESFSSVSEREQTVRDMGKSLQGEANLLFRGNSLLTQALDFHMRRLGKEYLEEILSAKIVEINGLDSNCEVDPARIAPGDDVNKNWSLLISMTTSIWDRIEGSASRCPTELRKILKYIRAVAEDRYGDFLRTVVYTSVSGFLFLRYFCPALLNPKLFGLLRDHPQPKAQRTLTLVAKSLQVLANLSTFGAKEAWMEPMNRFLSSHRQGVKNYIDDICAVPAEREIFAVPASYSTPTTILSRLPPTSREGFPSLPYLIDYARNFAALVKLWLEATSHLVAPQGLDGDLLAFNKLCVSLQQRTDEYLLRAEQGGRNADQLSLQWEDIVDSLEASTIHEVTNVDAEVQSRSPPWAEYTASITGGHQILKRPPRSSGSEIGPKEQKDRQRFWEATFGKESKLQKPYDASDSSQASPPARGPSRNGKPSRYFLSGLRKKAKEDGKETKETKPEISNPIYNDTGGLGSSWRSGGGMI